MLTPDKLNRLNELARKKKAGQELSEAELAEQNDLRQEYLANFRAGFRNTVEGIKIVDPEGQDVTPDAVKAIQADKGLHGRNQETE